ncbi:MATE family efflux transporter [Sphingomonas rubra]|uniref:Multidrug resistance protein, MATE family n=1 Tax=Sphingomonas rubra TaxID=634430 RepID=A0A1I5SSK4_9SPHN|nr:MATE family efflux transporter [Sphingomonas rubra]SFP73750.1 multidrug resistance protein, MATE family [Sphingomonas rubra]
MAHTAPPLAEAPASARSEARALLRLAGPLVAANLLQMAVFAVDVVFVARLGPTEFAAASLGVFLFNILTFALIGMGGAAEPIIAAALGRRVGAVREVRRTFRMALWLVVFAAMPVIAVLLAGERLFLLAGQDARVAARAGDFLDLLGIAVIPAAAAGLMRLTAAALGRPGYVFAVTAAGLGVGILANWLLVFGNAGFPALGLEGSAIARVAVSVAMLLAYALVLVTDRRLRRYRLFGRWWRHDWPQFGRVLRLGLPIALTWTFEGGLFGGVALLMGLIGVTEVAAHAVALNIAAFAFQVPFGVAQAATIRVGLAYGARDPVWMGRAGNVALLLGTGVMVLSAGLIWAIPGLLVGIYLDSGPASAATAALAVQFLAIAAVFQLVDGAQAVAQGVLRGLQDTRVPMLVALFGYWVVGFGSAALLGFRTPLAGVGIWWGLAIGLAVVAGLLLWRWSARERLGLLPGTARPI